MAGENFCLKWNDHHSVFFSNIESLCEKSFLTDVILSAGGQMYPAHKLVLCICSTYFQELFFKPQPAMQFNNTVIYLKDVDPTHLQLLLTYMYRGEVDVSENNLTEFLRTAAGLRVRGLTETDKQQMPPDQDLGGKRKLERVSETRIGDKKVRAESSVPSSLPVSRSYPHVIPATMEGLVIEEPPSTTVIKEERDLEPSTTWTTPVVRPGGAVVRSESVSGSGEAEETSDLTSDYPLEMTNYQTDISGGYEIEDKDTSYSKDPETMVVGDKLNKAYQCEMCNMSFNQKWLLRRHWKTHTGAKPYKCTVCSRTFSLRDSCTRHIKTVHKDLVDLTKDNLNTLVDVTDPDFEPNNVMTVQYND